MLWICVIALHSRKMEQEITPAAVSVSKAGKQTLPSACACVSA
jgi:hypothetical protein